MVVPPIGFLHFDQPPGNVHIKYGFVSGDDFYVFKMASGFYNNPEIGPTSEDQITVADQTGVAIKDIQTAEMVDHVMHSGDQR